jgi:glycosyltransferase involved in cell wall biosynthesis
MAACGLMRSLRILHLVTRSQRRGAEIAALELAHELDALGHHNTVVALAPAFDGSTEPGVPTLSRDPALGGRHFAASVWRVHRALRREPVDVVLAHGGDPAQVAAFARGRRPAVAWQRILDFPHDFWTSPQRRWWQLVVRRIDAAFALTPELVTEVERLGFGGPVWLVPNSRRPEPFLAVDRDTAGARLREETGVAPDVVLLGLVGALVEQKRPERALEVLQQLLAAGHRVHLVVVGDGPLRASLEARAREHGVAADVSFLGHRRDVANVLGGLDVVLLTSDVEGIPGVVIEAQMAGCPVVTFPLGRVAEVVDDGTSGVVLARPDVGAMVDAVAALVTDADARTRMGGAARARAREFATDRVAARYSAHLADLVDRTARGAPVAAAAPHAS